jgi:manganese-dependent inorganic pyrophosphatase
VGHKNPDNDSIASAVGLAYLRNQLAARDAQKNPDADVREYLACCLGGLPPESAWVLSENGLEEPQLIIDVKATGDEKQDVILVDHNETKQAVDGLEEANIVEIIDHHRLGDVTTAAPICFTSRPWGSTATIITTQFREAGIEIPQAIARVLLSAILTDTVILKSPTATPIDAKQVEYLSGIAEVEPVAFGKQLFACRGGEADLDIKTFVCADSKEFEVAGKTVLIAQHETVDLEGAMAREAEARAYMKKLADEHGYDFVLLLVTDILAEGSNFVVEGNHAVIDKVFGIDSSAVVWMPGVLSRKKQVAAPLLEV